MSDIKRCDYCTDEIEPGDDYFMIKMFHSKPESTAPMRERDCCATCFGSSINLETEKRTRTRRVSVKKPKVGRPRKKADTQPVTVTGITELSKSTTSVGQLVRLEDGSLAEVGTVANSK